MALGTDSLGLGPQEGTAQPPEPHRSGQERVSVRLVAQAHTCSLPGSDSGKQQSPTVTVTSDGGGDMWL